MRASRLNFNISIAVLILITTQLIRYSVNGLARDLLSSPNTVEDKSIDDGDEIIRPQSGTANTKVSVL